ncbi:DUF2796 domain-containing protein [Photobacterium sp. MCCC 1A19761]|uniref:zinc uptake protein ZrgA n=1 Tax=Photobacterium sp. MCCC 1A19761 TaxID=3115000 RepID=UPI00307E7A8E
MPSFRLSHCALMLGTLTFTQYAQADHHTYRQHDAHVHGVVEMNLAQDGRELLLEITAPGADIVGFEHAPETPVQQQAVKEAMSRLKQPDTLLAFTPAAHCQLREAQVEETLTRDAHEDHDHAHHDHDSHGEHEHEHHGHDDHDEHGHERRAHDDHDEHDHKHHEAHQHGEFSAQYTFHCDHIEQLKTMQVHWFSHFPSSEKVTVQAVTDTRQNTAQLTPGQTVFTF